jgi:hypothetical protein
MHPEWLKCENCLFLSNVKTERFQGEDYKAGYCKHLHSYNCKRNIDDYCSGWQCNKCFGGIISKKHVDYTHIHKCFTKEVS